MEHKHYNQPEVDACPLDNPDPDLAEILGIVCPEYFTEDDFGLWILVTPYVKYEQLNLADWPIAELKRYSAELKRILKEFDGEMQRRLLNIFRMPLEPVDESETLP